MRRYEPLVRRVVWKLRPPFGCEREDLAQEARIGLLAAIRAWRPERGPFPAFAECCVRNQALLAVAAAGRRKHQLISRAVSLEGEYGGYESTDRQLRLIDVLATQDRHADPEARLLISEQLQSIVNGLATLTLEERRALSGTLEYDCYDEFAPALGVTRKGAQQAAYRARCKLAAALPRAA
jgi:RNA polymerase sigma factor (sigma-70 family)